MTLFDIFQGHAWQTTVSAFNTVCSEKWLGSLMTSSGIIGQFTGAVFAGMYTDRFGRKNAILVFSALMALFSILQGVLNSELGFIFCRILVMACCQVAYIAALTYGVELTGPSKRSIPGSLINVYFSIGYSGISLVAWFIPDWQGLSVVLGIFGAIQVFLCEKLKIRKGEIIFRFFYSGIAKISGREKENGQSWFSS
jgi:OCT family organic cation transporter-like MFS transporter 4/5